MLRLVREAAGSRLRRVGLLTELDLIPVKLLDTFKDAAGDGVELIERVNPSWTVARALETYTHWKENVSALQELATLPGLSSDWLEEINARLA